MVVGFHKEASASGASAKLGATSVAVNGAGSFSVEDSCVVLTIPASKKAHQLKVYYLKGDASSFAGDKAVDVLTALTKGGPRQWTESVTTNGVVAADNQAYVVDQIALPFENPYGTKMRVGAFDFFSDGKSAAVSTWDGDVWIVTGIDDKLDNLTWTRFASGGHEPLGLKIVDDVVYTVDDAQITRYHDLNNDGQADFYENFNNDWDLTEGFHAFCFDLHTDKKGDFYFSFGAPVRGGGRSFERLGRHHGSILKVSKDGKTLERYASGLRAPNGIGVSPDGQVTSGDNEGTFVPRSPINWINKGDFGGVVDTYEHMDKLKTTASKADLHKGREVHLDPSEMPKPLAWLPKQVDNSGGGQVWVTSDKWGPFEGRMLHLSYGQSSVYLVMHEEKDGVVQGGVTKLPIKLSSSAMRARVNPADGQVYVSGLKGWQTNAAKPGGLDRIRYTGKPVHMVSGMKVVDKGILLEFTTKLDEELANDVASYSVQGKKITWSSAYGTKEEAETFKLTGAKLQPDGKSVLLEISDIRPVHMLTISVDVETADDLDELFTKIWSTIHFVN